MASRYCSLDLKGWMLRTRGPGVPGLLLPARGWDMAGPGASTVPQLRLRSCHLWGLGKFPLTQGSPSTL